MERRLRDSVILFVGLLCLITLTESETVRRAIRVGVILDSDSSLGDMARSCINISLQDFYSTHNSSITRLQLHFRDYSKHDLLTAASAARDLIDMEKVHAILGPENSEQARFIVALANKSDVPVIWFSPSGPSLLPPPSRFFIHSNATRSLCLQFEAIAAIIKAYGWQCVIPIFEEPEFGYDLIPCLSYALQDMQTRVPYTSAIRQDFTDHNITKELDNIKDNRTCVFVAHMSGELWSRLVKKAHDKGMMSKGYAWILTQGLSSLINPEATVINTKGDVDGALGVKPLVDVSLAKTSMNKYDKPLSLYGLWAYDTVTALAIAVEEANDKKHQKLLTAIQDIDFLGLSGNFSLRKGQIEPSQFGVYNVQDRRERFIGYWRPETGLFENYGEPAGKSKLKDPIWPGNATERPPKLKIGVPKTHFTEFVDVNVDGQKISATGLAVEVFKEVIEVLPFPYEFVPVDNTNGYDELLCNVKNKNVDIDIIIGDITIVASRTDCVNFTLPYLDSKVSMVVKVRSDSKSGWILFRPFDWSLWLILGGIFVVSTIIVLVLESKRQDNDGSKFRHFVLSPFLIYKGDIDFLKSGTSKSVVIVVMFLLGIAVQVYTANLTSVLTEMTTAKPSPWKDLQEIKRNNRIVGYQKDSWVKGLLIEKIGFDSNNLMALGSGEEYNKALSNEEKVDAIIDETPYLMLLLSNCSSCKMTGLIYKTGGFAFAFPKSSTLVSNFSDAILNVTQNVKIFHDMKSKISLPITLKNLNTKVALRREV